MTTWTTKRLDQLGRVVTGKTPMSERPEEFGDRYPFITPSDIPASQKYVRTERFLSMDGYQRHRKICLPPKSTCVVCIGATIGKACTTHAESFTNQQINSIIPFSSETDADFLYYVATQLRDVLLAYAGGAATPIVNKSSFSSIRLKVPSIDVQGKIGAILSAYDDLIENNKRRIAILEKMAEEIYREWFVRMRFPASAKATAGKPGSKVRGLPSGWKVSELREVATVNATSLGKKNLPEMINYIDISAVGTNRIDSVTAILASQAPGRARRVVQHGDIIWSSVRPANRAYCLILNPVPNLVVSTGFAVIRSKGSVPFSYLYFAVTTDAFVEQMSLVAKGSAYPATSFEDFERAKLIIPSEALLFQFDEICLPIFLEKETLLRQNQVLGSCRDLLLPRLISGKLSVETLDLPSTVSASSTGSALPQAERAHA